MRLNDSHDIRIGEWVHPSLAFSTYSYLVGIGQPNPPLPESVELGRLSFIGLGAGGGAFAFTLASLKGLRGTLNLVEPAERSTWLNLMKSNVPI